MKPEYGRYSTPGSSRMTRFGCWAFIAVLLAAFSLPAIAAESTARCVTKPYVVKIHADWCGSCRATQATWDQVVSELSDQATMIRFDVTDRASYEVAVADAKRFGLSDFLQEYRRRTGAIAVLDCRTREPLEVLSGERDFTKYRDAIEKANSRSRLVEGPQTADQGGQIA